MPSPQDPDQAWRHMALQIGHWKLKGFGYWAVDRRDSNEFVGGAGLWQSPGWPELELGYWLVKERQGKGYALEACLRCIEYAREVLKAGSLVSYIDPDNEPSIRLAKRLGAVYDGTIQLCHPWVSPRVPALLGYLPSVGGPLSGHSSTSRWGQQRRYRLATPHTAL